MTLPDALAASGTSALLQPLELALLGSDFSALATAESGVLAGIAAGGGAMAALGLGALAASGAGALVNRSVCPNRPSGKLCCPSTALYAHTAFKKAQSAI